MEKSSTYRIKDLENKVRELERIVGQKQIKIDYLDKMICLAGEELGVDIKKLKYSTVSWFNERKEKLSRSVG